MGGKRNNGEGTWGKKKINGHEYFFYRGADKKYVYAKTKKELKEKVKTKEEKPFMANEHTTFGEYILDWVKIKENVIEKSTYDGYNTLIDSMIISFDGYDLANKTLTNLSPMVFQAYLNSLAEKYARSSITKIWQLIRQCVKYGETQEEIKPNTMSMVKVPLESYVAVKKKEIPFVDNDELNRLYDLLENYTDKKNVHRYRNSNNAHAIILIAYTGLRVGEMTALKWKNVNIRGKYIDIAEATGSVKDSEGRYTTVDKAPKTESSKRRVPLPARGMEMIEYFDKANPEHNPDDFVCVTSNNTQMIRRNVYRTLEIMCRDAGLPRMSIHSLRHSYGSILLNKGADIKTISTLLGHKNISTTYDIYIGVDEKNKTKVVQMFDK